MTVRDLNDSLIGNDVILVNPGWDIHLARWISRIGSPPVLFMGMTLFATASAADKEWGNTAVYLILTLVIPIAYIIYLVLQGKATDFDISVRQQRVIPMFVSLAGAAAGWLYFLTAATPHVLMLLAAANLLINLLIAVITLYWKISVHSTTAAAGAVLIWIAAGSPVLFLIVPLIIWSRVRLKRHTLRQTVAGTLLGSSIVGMLFFIFGV